MAMARRGACVTCGSTAHNWGYTTPDGRYTCHMCCFSNRQATGFYGPLGSQSREEADGGFSRSCAECGANRTHSWRGHKRRPGLLVCNACHMRYKRNGSYRRCDSTVRDVSDCGGDIGGNAGGSSAALGEFVMTSAAAADIANAATTAAHLPAARDVDAAGVSVSSLLHGAPIGPAGHPTSDPSAPHEWAVSTWQRAAVMHDQADNSLGGDPDSTKEGNIEDNRVKFRNKEDASGTSLRRGRSSLGARDGPCDTCGLAQSLRWYQHKMHPTKSTCQACYDRYRRRGTYGQHRAQMGEAPISGSERQQAVETASGLPPGRVYGGRGKGAASGERRSPSSLEAVASALRAAKDGLIDSDAKGGRVIAEPPPLRPALPLPPPPLLAIPRPMPAARLKGSGPGLCRKRQRTGSMGCCSVCSDVQQFPLAASTGIIGSSDDDRCIGDTGNPWHNADGSASDGDDGGDDGGGDGDETGRSRGRYGLKRHTFTRMARGKGSSPPLAAEAEAPPDACSPVVPLHPARAVLQESLAVHGSSGTAAFEPRQGLNVGELPAVETAAAATEAGPVAMYLCFEASLMPTPSLSRPVEMETVRVRDLHDEGEAAAAAIAAPDKRACGVKAEPIPVTSPGELNGSSEKPRSAEQADVGRSASDGAACIAAGASGADGSGPPFCAECGSETTSIYWCTHKTPPRLFSCHRCYDRHRTERSYKQPPGAVSTKYAGAADHSKEVVKRASSAATLDDGFQFRGAREYGDTAGEDTRGDLYGASETTYIQQPGRCSPLQRLQQKQKQAVMQPVTVHPSLPTRDGGNGQQLDEQDHRQAKQQQVRPQAPCGLPSSDRVLPAVPTTGRPGSLTDGAEPLHDLTPNPQRPPEAIPDVAFLAQLIQRFAATLSASCEALVEMEDLYGIRLLESSSRTLQPTDIGSAGGDGGGAACWPSPPPSPGPSPLRQVYEELCGSDRKLRAKMLGDLALRWLEDNAWRRPLELMLGRGVRDLGLDRVGPVEGLNEQQQADWDRSRRAVYGNFAELAQAAITEAAGRDGGSTAPELLPRTAHVCDGSSTSGGADQRVTSSAIQHFLTVTDHLAEGLAGHLLGRDPIPPSPPGPSQEQKTRTKLSSPPPSMVLPPAAAPTRARHSSILGAGLNTVGTALPTCGTAGAATATKIISGTSHTAAGVDFEGRYDGDGSPGVDDGLRRINGATSQATVTVLFRSAVHIAVHLGFQVGASSSGRLMLRLIPPGDPLPSPSPPSSPPPPPLQAAEPETHARRLLFRSPAPAVLKAPMAVAVEWLWSEPYSGTDDDGDSGRHPKCRPGSTSAHCYGVDYNSGGSGCSGSKTNAVGVACMASKRQSCTFYDDAGMGPPDSPSSALRTTPVRETLQLRSREDQFANSRVWRNDGGSFLPVMVGPINMTPPPALEGLPRASVSPAKCQNCAQHGTALSMQLLTAVAQPLSPTSLPVKSPQLLLAAPGVQSLPPTTGEIMMPAARPTYPSALPYPLPMPHPSASNFCSSDDGCIDSFTGGDRHCGDDSKRGGCDGTGVGASNSRDAMAAVLWVVSPAVVSREVHWERGLQKEDAVAYESYQRQTSATATADFAVATVRAVGGGGLGCSAAPGGDEGAGPSGHGRWVVIEVPVVSARVVGCGTLLHR
ncbi:hypothetical protein Vafri_22 [Volvox africanus]|nr:hypothetical protein Vafri_22 [Volvox africanus]